MVDYLSVVDPLLRSFRSEILDNFGATDHTEKHDDTVVTELDRSIEERIRKVLEKTYPNIGVHGEEFGKSGNENVYWLVDPIDGTENFIRGIAGIGTIIGLVEDGKVVFTAIYEPLQDEMYHACKGEGAFMNNKKIAFSKRSLSSSFYQVVGAQADDQFLRVMKLMDEHSVSALRLFGAAQQAMLLASGKIDGSIHLYARGSDWDYAPGRLLVSEAGAEIIYFDVEDEIASRSYAVLPPTHTKLIREELIRAVNG